MAGMLAVAVASSRTLEVLDLEGTGLTNQSAQVRRGWGLHCGRPRRIWVGIGVWLGRSSVHALPPLVSLQTLLDMVENYPTALRSLVLAENSISPELQQQICDLLSEGEEEEEAAGAAEARERERGQESEGHQRGNSSWICPHGESPREEVGKPGLAAPLPAVPGSASPIPPQIAVLRWC